MGLLAIGPDRAGRVYRAARPRPALALRRGLVALVAPCLIMWPLLSAHADASAAESTTPPRSANGAATAHAGATAGLSLDVLLVNDSDFPPVDEAQARAILAEARATLADKLGFAELTFHVRGEQSVESFIARHTGGPDSCLQQLTSYRVGPGGKRAVDIPAEVIQRFLGRWSVEELRSFFPEAQRVGLDSHEAIGRRLAAELDRKLEQIASFRLANGQSLLTAGKLEERSYIYWICAVRNQDEADLILTNAFILYDLGSEPYPHTVFQKNKVGGASLFSPKRQAIRSRAVISSTFSMVTDIALFRESGVEGLAVEQRAKVIGTFIVAHELGHAVFKLPDFYDHPPGCLMTTKLETGYVNGYRALKSFPGACSKCRPYVSAKRHVFAAAALRRQGQRNEAIAELKEAIRSTPEHIDGSYLRYIADLSYDIAEMHAELGQRAEAARWISSILRIVPAHSRALVLRDELPKDDSSIRQGR